MANNMYKARSEDSLGPSSTLFRRSQLQALADSGATSQVAQHLSSIVPRSILATALPANVAELYRGGSDIRSDENQWGSDVAWPHLVSLASRTMGETSPRPISNATSTPDLATSYSLRLQAAHQQIFCLQEKLRKAQEELTKVLKSSKSDRFKPKFHLYIKLVGAEPSSFC